MFLYNSDKSNIKKKNTKIDIIIGLIILHFE